MKRTLKITTMFLLIITMICTVLMITQKSYSLEDMHTLTIKKETIDNVSGSFDFLLSVYKETIIPEATYDVTLTVSKDNDGNLNFIIQHDHTTLPYDNEITYTLSLNTGKQHAYPIERYAEFSYDDNNIYKDLIDNWLTLDHENSGSLYILTHFYKFYSSGMCFNTGYFKDSTVTTTINKSLMEQLSTLPNGESLDPVTFTIHHDEFSHRQGYVENAPEECNYTASMDDGPYSYSYRFTLKNGEQETFTIPRGFKYDIREVLYEDTMSEWKLVSKTNDKGTIESDVVSVFTNKLETFDLTIKKETVDNKKGTFSFKPTITGFTSVGPLDINYRPSFINKDSVLTGGTVEELMEFFDHDAEFYNPYIVNDDFIRVGDFKMRSPIDNKEYQLYFRWGYLLLFVNLCEFKNDTINISNGENFVISGIPLGYTYEIDELSQEGWEFISINDDTSMTKAEGTMTDNITYTFKNQSTKEDAYDEPTSPVEKEKTLPPTEEKIKETKEKPTQNNNSPKTGLNNKISNLVLLVGLTTFIISIIVNINGYVKSQKK